MNIIWLEESIGLPPISVFAENGEMTVVPGKLFEAGDYPAKQFSLTEEEAAAEAERFNAAGSAARMNYEHRPGILDNELGEIRRVWTQGREIWADFAVPAWLAAKAKAKNIPLKVSAEFDRTTKRLQGAAWVLNPHIKDAQLIAFHDEFMEEANSDPEAETTDSDQTAPDNSEIAGGESPEGNSSMTREQRIAKFLDDAKKENREVSAADIAALFSEDETRLQELEQESRKMRAEAIADDLIKNQRKGLPAQREAMIAVFSQAIADDSDAPATVTFSRDDKGKPVSSSRLEALKSVFSALPIIDMTTEQIDPNQSGKDLAARFNMTETETGTDDGDMSEKRRRELLSQTASGRAILADEAAKK